jgi:lambda family phage minor tail protein L
MRTLDATSKTEKDSPSNKPIFLYTINNYTGTSDLNLAEYDTDITYPTSGGTLYTRFPITHDFVGENIQLETDKVKVRVSNVSRLIQAYLELYDFRGKQVDIRMVWANQLADADAFIKHTLYIESYTADQNDVEFVLTSRFNVLDLELPTRKYSRNYCGWKFKSSECGYGDGETECNKTLQRCKELSNQLSFGGFPSIPSKRIFVS